MRARMQPGVMDGRPGGFLSSVPSCIAVPKSFDRLDLPDKKIEDLHRTILNAKLGPASNLCEVEISQNDLKVFTLVFGQKSKANLEKLDVGICGSTSKASVQFRCVEFKMFCRTPKCPKEALEDQGVEIRFDTHKQTGSH